MYTLSSSSYTEMPDRQRFSHYDYYATEMPLLGDGREKKEKRKEKEPTKKGHRNTD